MKLSESFSKTKKDAPKDEVARNAQLLIRAGFIHKEMAGVYSFLPLGLKVLNNIIQIIREEMDAIGGQEILLAALQARETWQRTGRWSDDVVDDWFKTKLKNNNEVGLGFTHEEPLAALLSQAVSSYKDLPVYLYQFQTKFSNELRAKSGILRSREFIMKDLYSFCRDQAEHDKFYEQASQAYTKIFKRIGLGNQTFITFASGGTFSKFSHEFQTLCAAGEDTLYLDRTKKIAINKEIYSPATLKELGFNKSRLEEVKAVEVGNIFSLGTKFSIPLELTFTDQKGAVKPAVMGSYGIGPARVMGTVVELMADDRGLVWPDSIAPARVHLVSLSDDKQVTKAADQLYKQLIDQGIDTVYDDRDESIGVKLSDADLLGIPSRVVVSQKTLAKASVELKQRTSKQAKLIKNPQLLAQLAS